MKLTSWMAFALAITLAATGCRNHRPVGVTTLPRTPGENITDQTGPTLPSEPNPQNTGGIPMPNIEDINGMAADRSALASSTVHFAYDSAAVRKSERQNIETVASTLKSNPGTKLMIEGNCDERGTEEYNRSLGERRAQAVRQALVRQGISASRIFTKSYGKDKPADPGHDESAWSQNRRDEFVLLRPKSGA